MQHQKIRPQTITPTISAATEDQVHRVRIRSAWWVTPVGQPKRIFASAWCAEQPVSSTAAPTISRAASRGSGHFAARA